MNKYLLIYIISINILSFLLFGIDKYKAIKNKYRIPEKVLLLISLFGGSIGSILGMIIFHHKTKKPLFIIMIPIFITFNVIILSIMFK